MVVRRKILILTCLIFVICLDRIPASSQILRDSASLNIVMKSISSIYDLKFNESKEFISKLSKAYPDHPVVYVLEAMQMYWENYPMTTYSADYNSFEKKLRKCIEICSNKTDTADEAEFLLTNLSARGLLLLFYLDNDLTMSVIPLAASTYKYIRLSFEFTSAYNDFFFFTGLYDYTREAYPEAYPVYKPLAMLFPKGDKAKGLQEIKKAAQYSIYFRAEAYSFLSDINLSFENNYEQAYLCSKSVQDLYPANLEYLGLHLRNLLFTKRYDEAERLIKSSGTKTTNPFYQAQLTIYKGVLQEKKYYNDKLAEQLYLKGIEDISVFGHYGNEFTAYGYFGLSRINARKGEGSLEKSYRKKAVELADFKNVNFD